MATATGTAHASAVGASTPGACRAFLGAGPYSSRSRLYHLSGSRGASTAGDGESVEREERSSCAVRVLRARGSLSPAAGGRVLEPDLGGGEQVKQHDDRADDVRRDEKLRQRAKRGLREMELAEEGWLWGGEGRKTSVRFGLRPRWRASRTRSSTTSACAAGCVRAVLGAGEHHLHSPLASHGLDARLAHTRGGRELLCDTALGCSTHLGLVEPAHTE